MSLRLRIKPEDLTRLLTYTPGLLDPGISPLPLGFTALGPGSTPNRIHASGGEGTAWVYAEVNAYGTLLRDSVLYTMTYPFTGTIQAGLEGLVLRPAGGSYVNS